jgi:amidohydrolase
MPVINRIAEFHPEITAWRRHIHAHPETGFEEIITSDFIAGKLTEFGIEVHRGMAKTGVIGTLSTGDGPGIGLRADMDALDVEEQNDFAHRSVHPGKMHACGHDGHVAMLLGAARYLAETRNFKGTVQFIFQPAEEGGGGGRVMVEEGLFEKFPVDSVYGLHNWPGYAVGRFAAKAGPIQAAVDIFEITLKGQGCHAAMPDQGKDPVVAAAQVVNALQTIASRNTHPLESAVVSVTQIHAGNTWNVIPDEVVLRGTTRSFAPHVRDTIEDAMGRITQGIAATHGISAELDYQRDYPPTVNHAAETEIAAGVAAEIVGEANVERNPLPTMGAEDFSYMLEAKPGCYLWIGNGEGKAERGLHKPLYDFNDEILPAGASFFARLVETVLI